MSFYNGWKTSHLIQWDKFNLTLRVSKITLIRIDLDISKRMFDINIFNFGITNKKV